ncbi:MAG: Plasmid stabilization system protein [Chloroflexi bacterium ADurb.Bin325]|nr:MAG: Plasmid stabilization system protein [Chloroflexi bacterium ADurb.Bin325]
MTEPIRWTVILLRQPNKILARLPADLRRRLLAALHKLEDDPRPQGYRKLEGYEDLYRVRVGDWRIIYAIRDAELIVLVVEVAPRGSAYRDL